MKTLLLAFLLASSLAAFGQGQVYFNNRITTPGMAFLTPIYGVNPNAPDVRISGNASTNGGSADYTGCTPLSGSGWTASLWAADPGTTDMSAFRQFGATTTFRTSTTTGGIIQTPQAPVIPWNPEQAVSFQVRAWNNNHGTILTWAEALANADRGIATGFSDIFTMNIGGGPFAPPNMVGLKSFNVTIPEPTTLALALLCVGGSLARRRLK